MMSLGSWPAVAVLVTALALLACGGPPVARAAPPAAAGQGDAESAGARHSQDGAQPAPPAPAGEQPSPLAPLLPAAPATPPDEPAPARIRTAPHLVSQSLSVPAAFRRAPFNQDRQVQIQDGFAISVYALVGGARSMTVAPWGELLVTQPGQGRIVALRDEDGDGTAERSRALAEGLQCPYGMAVRDGYLYVAQSTKVERFADNGGAGLGPAELVVGGLPASGCGPHHYRPLAFDWAGYFYVAFGSSCNVCIEGDPRRGTVWQYALDGNGREFARGLRNVVDLEIHPATGELWGATNERDYLGDDVPPDPVAPIAEGADYGWPYCYWNGGSWVVDTRVPQHNPSCSGLTPYNGVQAHTAPLGIAFYSGAQFPADYWGSAFVGLHGSWNRSVATGYKVMRIPTVDGAPLPAEEFVAGWLTGTRGSGGDAWGRPVDVQVGPDGSLFVSDDQAGAIYRITYNGTSQS